ncbi:MAG: hypothetical protein GEU83_15125 [Pseudonocardiaceae bacterium]|nr:hypothetical protein [Pseudonocardiaceae bacterium]
MTAARTTHECPGGCGRQVARHHFACRACWYRLPSDLRRPISATYRRDAGAHPAAMAEAVAWYRTPPPAMPDETSLVLGEAGGGKAAVERFEFPTAQVTHGVAAWWCGYGDECDFDELVVHSHDRRRVLAAASVMIRTNGVECHDIAVAEVGWCRLVTECGCTAAQHDGGHSEDSAEDLDCEQAGCRFPLLPPCGEQLDAPDGWQLDRVPEHAPGAVAFTRVVLS